MNPIREVVDLAHDLYNGMPNLGADIVAFWRTETFEGTARLTDGKYSCESRMMLLSEHCGTHFDAPYHFDPAQPTVDQVPFERLVLPGHLLDFRHRGPGELITVADFEQAVAQSGRPLGPGTAVIAWTGQDANWGKPGFQLERPGVPTETAEWLVEQGISLLCSDLIGIDDPADHWWRTHKILLGAGIPLVQQLCHLERLVGKEFLFTVLPLRMVGGTASPVRAVALVL